MRRSQICSTQRSRTDWRPAACRGGKTSSRRMRSKAWSAPSSRCRLCSRMASRRLRCRRGQSPLAVPPGPGSTEESVARDFEGRSWRGFHHHATLCIAAYGFLIRERAAIPPSGPPRRQTSRISTRPRPRGAADPTRTAYRKLDRDNPKTTHGCAGSNPVALPVLPSLPGSITYAITLPEDRRDTVELARTAKTALLQ